MLLKTLKRAGFGFILGIAIGNLMALLAGGPDVFAAELLQRAGSFSNALLWQTLLSGILGAVSMGGVSLYEIERWPLLLIAVVHFTLIEAAYIPIAFSLCWLGNAKDALIWVGFSAATYLVIFFIMYARYRTEVRKLNQMQQQFLGENENMGGNV